jgi:hypothetical protein
MTHDDLIEKLGASQQKVMSLTVQNRSLKKRAQVAEERAEILEELVMDVVGDLRDGIRASAIDYRIGKVMQRLEGDK